MKDKIIQWGILGLGNISGRFAQSLTNSKNGTLYGAASYTQYKRENFKEKYPNVNIYDNYDDLLKDPTIDVVYIALPHADHYKWSKEALLNGKAVLCEKPATLSYQETLELCNLSKEKNLVFMEAMKTRFIPAITEIKKVIADGMIGDIKRVETCFCGQMEFQEGRYIFDKEQGGALYDMGNYNIASTLDYIHADVIEIKPHVEYKYGVDCYDDIELVFDTKQTARIEVGLDRTKERTLNIIGTKGTITSNNFYRPEQFTINLNNGESAVIKKPYIQDDFFGEIEEIHNCINDHEYESKGMSHQDSLDCINLLEKIKQQSI